MHTKPGMAERLMGNMMFPTKFTLVSVLFLIPLIFTLILYWQESSRNIDRLGQELQGMQLINRLEPALLTAGSHRGLTHASLNGDRSVRAELTTVRTELSQQLTALQQQAIALQAPATITDRLAQIQQQWDTLLTARFTDPQQHFTQHNALIEQIRTLFIEVARSWQLELDADAQSTFLINLAVETLPVLVDEAGRVRDAATGVAAQGRFTPDSYIYLNNQLNQLQPQVTALARYGSQLTGAGTALQAEVNQATQQLDDLYAFVKSRVVDPDKIGVSSGEVFQAGTLHLQPALALYDHLMPMLESLLTQRLARLELHRQLVLAVLVLTVGAAIYLFMGFYRYTLATVTGFSEQAARLAEGDLSVRLEARGRDEMRAVVEGFNQVADGFQQLVRQTASSTALVTQSAAAMNTESGQTLQGAAQQKQEADAIAAAVAELAHSAGDIASHSAVAAASAQRADEISSQGRTVVTETARSFTGMMDEVARTSAVIGQLDKDVQAIGELSTVIREIAEQTNLLALNAAIEAARAGEQGRGFAVVADEVRNLAQRTQSSTEEIQSTIESLQACTRDSVELMTSTHGQVSANVDEITRAGALLREIDTAVADMNQKNAQIATAVQAQNQLVECLQGNIATVAQVADSTEGSARQSASLAEEMSRSSGVLQQSLAAFRIS